MPYAFENRQSRSGVPWPRFEDKAEVRSLEMNAAIARFFDPGDENGNMLRGATPGGAPTLRDMTPYRPHVTPGADFLGATLMAVKEIRKHFRNRTVQKGEEMLRALLLAQPPTPSPSPTTSPSPGVF
ncbi:MAG: hypothetical protein JJE39_10495 [Vicinamibacteria bacterium]|nr:hypothetical protein [Vicinamibacteria bacterium]